MMELYYGEYVRNDPELSKQLVFNINRWFDNNYRKEWLNNEFAKKIIKDIDKSEHIKDNLIESPFLGAIPPKLISGGAKLLISMYNRPDLIYWGTSCGDNCAKWILEISRIKNVRIVFEHLMEFDINEKDLNIKFINTGELITNGKHLMEALIDEDLRLLYKNEDICETEDSFYYED